MRVRAATAADAGMLARLAGQLGYPADGAQVARRLADIAGDGGGVVLVAEAAQRGVIGFAHALPQHSLVEERFVELAALVVADSARGQGVGAALLRAVEAWAQGSGFGSVRVHSNVVRERAHAFYRREGYAAIKRQAVFCKQLPETSVKS